MVNTSMCPNLTGRQLLPSALLRLAHVPLHLAAHLCPLNSVDKS